MRGFSEFKASALALIAANLLPLFGVIFLGWDAFAIVALYWAENVVIGVINILKMITCNPDPRAIDWSKFGTPEQVAQFRSQLDEHGKIEIATLAHHGSKLFLVPFFAFHYGFFCFVHGVFVFAVFGHESFSFGPLGELSNFVREFSNQHLWWGVIALAASHLYSFFVNYIGRGEYRRTVVPFLMVQPYARVIVLHVAILFGGFVAMALGSNVGVLAILVIGKTLLDLSLHLREHARIEGDQSMIPETVLDEKPSTGTI